MDKWRKESRETELIEKLVELLSGKINLGTCKYARAFEWWAKKAEENRVREREEKERVDRSEGSDEERSAEEL